MEKTSKILLNKVKEYLHLQDKVAMGKFHSHILTFSYSHLLSLLLIFSAQFCTAQSVTVTLRADSSHILIGDHLNLQLKVKHTKGLQVIVLPPADTVGNMDVVTAAKIDTTQEGPDQVLTQNYVVSAFDSGEYHAGPVMVYLKKATGEVDTIFSNVFPVLVNTLPVDTSKPFKAIKAPLAVPYSWRDFIPYYLAALLLIIAIAVSTWLWLRYRRKRPVVVERPKPKDPAHIWARRELQKLEEEKIWQKGEDKLYYSKLSDILRLYLEYRYDWLALESTTEEIEDTMGNYNLKEKAKSSLLEILRMADLVKFAKMRPMPDANMRAMDNAYKFIEFTEPKEEKANVPTSS